MQMQNIIKTGMRAHLAAAKQKAPDRYSKVRTTEVLGRADLCQQILPQKNGLTLFNGLHIIYAPGTLRVWSGTLPIALAASVDSLSEKAEAKREGREPNTEDRWKTRMKGREGREGSSIKQRWKGKTKIPLF